MSKKKQEEHENAERWFIPYADMITLLFAVFVVLYTMSARDVVKLTQASESISKAFIGIGAYSRKSELNQTLPIPHEAVDIQIVNQLKKVISEEGFDLMHDPDTKPIQIKLDSRGVVISMSAGHLFDSGSTEVKPEWYPIIGTVADIINESGRFILVEGHTDKMPSVGSLYYSNWELSALRATSMTRLLIDEFKVNPIRLTASAYSQFRPIASNDTEEGRIKNRRVDIVMLNASRLEELKESPSIPH